MRWRAGRSPPPVGYEADMVASALANVGVGIESATAGLDFGCSSGRLVRVLAAAYPEVQWHGCDPNGPAIEWAQRAYPRVNLFLSSNAPPLALPDGSLDLACAISIWSHFALALGLRWFDEMHRVIRPGGHLVCTTPGRELQHAPARAEVREQPFGREEGGAPIGVDHAPIAVGAELLRIPPAALVEPTDDLVGLRGGAQRVLDVEVNGGEAVRNGSGKSTLLKCIAGIYGVDAGRISIAGRLSPFIELGVGFNLDLTARDFGQ